MCQILRLFNYGKTVRKYFLYFFHMSTNAHFVPFVEKPVGPNMEAACISKETYAFPLTSVTLCGPIHVALMITF